MPSGAPETRKPPGGDRASKHRGGPCTAQRPARRYRMKRSIGTLALSLLLVCACSQKKGSGVDEAEKLQRGGLCAVATYEEAIAKIDRADSRATLSRIREEHNQ